MDAATNLGFDTVFVERAWAQSRIDSWLLDPTSPTLIVVGPAGSGKSTLIKQLTRTGTHHSAIHLCRGHLFPSTEPIQVVAAVAAMLARSTPGFADAVTQEFTQYSRRPAVAPDPIRAGLVRRVVLDAPDGVAAYERGLRHPLSRLAATGKLDRDVLVVIDGLDEGTVGLRRTGLVELLAQLSGDLVPHLRLLITARPGPISELFNDCSRIDLAHDPSIVDNIDSFLTGVPTVRRKGRRRIANAAEGNFVYAALAAQSNETAMHPPSGLDELYRHVLGDLDPLGAHVLGLLCGGRDQGFTSGMLATMVPADRDDVHAVLASFRRVLTGGELIRPHHRCLADFLASIGLPTGRLIAENLVARWSRRWDTCDDMYALRNVLPHLADAALAAWSRTGVRRDADPAVDALRETLADPAYIAAALATVGVDDLRSALSYVRHRVDGVAADVDVMDRLLQGEARTVRECQTPPVKPASQLVYAAATMGATDIAQRFAGWAGADGVQVLWATVQSTSTMTPENLQGHDGVVSAITAAADGTQAVTAADDGTMRVWRLASGRVSRTLPTEARVVYVHTGSDAEDVVAGYADGAAQVWDATQQGERVIGAVTRVTAFAVNGDASRGLSGDPDHGATVWDLLSVTGEPLLRLPRHAGRVILVAVTADGYGGATATMWGAVAVWDLTTGQKRMEIDHGRMVTALCLTPRADRIVIGDADGLSVHLIADSASQATDPCARLATRASVTALAANPALDNYVLFGTATGQVAYVHVP